MAVLDTSSRRSLKLRERRALDFIAHAKTARVDQIGQLLAPDLAPAVDDEPRRRLKKGEPRPPAKQKGGKHSWPEGRHQRVAATLPFVNYWTEELGLVEKYRPYNDMPTWVMATEAGLRWLGLSYKPIDFPEDQLEHIYVINEVRLFLLRSRKIPPHAWTSERELDIMQPQKTRGLELPHQPDGIMTLETGGELSLGGQTIQLEGGERIAVEAERSRKNFEEIRKILPDLVARYDRAWYFCTPGAYDAVGQIRAEMDSAARERIHIWRLTPNWWDWKQEKE